MLALSGAELTALAARGRVLQTKLGAPAVIEHDDLITKVWSRRQWPSSDWFHPYAHRFRRNAERLRMRGVDAPEVTAYGRVTGTNKRYVTYPLIPGEALRAASFDPRAFAAFIASLHSRGVYFRSLHLGNVLVCNGAFALIDVTDVTFRRGALSLAMRARNLRFLASYPADAARLEPRGVFFAAYGAAGDLGAHDVATLERAFARSLESGTRG